jgi:hypothetical protein
MILVIRKIFIMLKNSYNVLGFYDCKEKYQVFLLYQFVLLIFSQLKIKKIYVNHVIIIKLIQVVKILSLFAICYSEFSHYNEF